MMRQPKKKTMSHYINTLLEATDIANVYDLTPNELLITLTPATCTDDALQQELIKLEATYMKEVQDKVNKWETRMNTASRMLSAYNRHERREIPAPNQTPTSYAIGAGVHTNRTCARSNARTSHVQNATNKDM